jgi:hypothetical protein
MKPFGWRNVQARPDSRTARSERTWERATAFERSPPGAAARREQHDPSDTGVPHVGERLTESSVAAEEEHTDDAVEVPGQRVGAVQVADGAGHPVRKRTGAVANKRPHLLAAVE